MAYRILRITEVKVFFFQDIEKTLRYQLHLFLPKG